MQPGLRQDERVVLAAVQLPQSRFHVAANFQHLQIGPLMQELRPAAKTASVDAGIFGSSASDFAELQTSTSAMLSRSGTAARESPSTSAVGRSFRL